ncbi:MAG: L-threonylcarbamoyladenylate synthase [Spirochaetes bacterium]|nr:L-threonylcarbamoyladenylate synthase [Spirochaetota bacterium]
MKRKCDVFYIDGTNEESVAHRISRVLGGGGICVIPTDTLYGVVAVDRCDAAARRLYEIKRRPAGKPFIRLIGRIDTFSEYSRQRIPKRLKPYWPGPLTLVVRGVNEPTVALRFASTPWLDSLFHGIGYGAILAPSANRSGETEIFENGELIRTFRSSVDAIVCVRGGIPVCKPSTILDITSRPFRIVREGAVDIADSDLR